ncbi:MAG: hypothetical protein HXN98_08785 [Prevotella salivae]|nr:hypothetical protein [Segatella salivae]
MRYEDIIKQITLAFLLAAAFIIVMMLHGCRTKQIVVPEYHSVIVNHHDTLTRHDSIYQREFVDRYIKGDTIYLTRTKVDYRYRTLFRTRWRDSLRVDSITKIKEVPAKLTRWQKVKQDIGGWAMVALSGAILVAVVWLIYRGKKIIRF